MSGSGSEASSSAIGACVRTSQPSPNARASTRSTVDRTPRRHAREIRQRSRLDPVAARLHRPRLEPQPRNRRGVAVEPVVRVAHECLERLRESTLDTPEKILALNGAQLRKSTNIAASRGALDGLEKAREQRLDLGRRRGHREDVVERQRAAFRKSLALRHEGVEYQSKKIPPRSERPLRHERLRIILSAT